MRWSRASRLALGESLVRLAWLVVRYEQHLEAIGKGALACVFPTNRFRWLSGFLVGCVLLLPASGRAAETTNPPPAKLKISGYGFFGNRSLKRTLRTLELSGKKPESFGAAFIEDAVLLIRARLVRDGYLKPKMMVRLKMADGGTLRINAGDLLENPLPPGLVVKEAEFKIKKGVFYYFRQIRFEGLTAIKPKAAKAYFIETEALLNLKGGRVYTPDRVAQGISSLRDVLDRRGFAEATVEATQQEANEQTGAADVVIQVAQGPRFIVRSIREEIFIQSTNSPAEVEVLSPRRDYSRVWVQDFSQALKTNLYTRGYPDVSVDLAIAKIEVEGSASSGAPSTPAEAGSRNTIGTALAGAATNVPAGAEIVLMDLIARVYSGPQVRVGAVEFQGYKRTRPSLVERRVRVQKGDLLNPIQVEEGRHRLAQLGIFESVDVAYAPGFPGERDVIYRVKEGRRTDVSLLFGYGSYELLRAGLEVQERNIWGLAHHARLKAVQSFKATSGEFVYTVPEFLGRDLDLFANGNALRREEVSFNREEYGGGVGVHKYFKRQSTDVSLRYNYQILSALDTVPTVATEGLTNPAVGSIIADLKYDHRDNPLYPRTGYKLFTSFESATRNLGGDANYERVEVSPSFHQPLGGGRYLGFGVTHGVVVSFGSPAENLPFNRRFFPGGDNSIRGYTEGKASPRNERGQIVGAETYTLGTVEFEQALTRQWSIVLFSDSIGFARRLDNFPFDTGLFSAGGGIRWKTIVGPIRVEYGYNLNPREEDPTGTLHFSLGFPF